MHSQFIKYKWKCRYIYIKAEQSKLYFLLMLTYNQKVYKIKVIIIIASVFIPSSHCTSTTTVVTLYSLVLMNHPTSKVKDQAREYFTPRHFFLRLPLPHFFLILSFLLLHRKAFTRTWITTKNIAFRLEPLSVHHSSALLSSSLLHC